MNISFSLPTDFLSRTPSLVLKMKPVLPLWWCISPSIRLWQQQQKLKNFRGSFSWKALTVLFALITKPRWLQVWKGQVSLWGFSFSGERDTQEHGAYLCFLYGWSSQRPVSLSERGSANGPGVGQHVPFTSIELTPFALYLCLAVRRQIKYSVMFSTLGSAVLT